MFTINQYINKIYSMYEPGSNTVEDAMNLVIEKYPDQRTPSLDEEVRKILDACKDIADYIMSNNIEFNEKSSDDSGNCANCPYKGRRVF